MSPWPRRLLVTGAVLLALGVAAVVAVNVVVVQRTQAAVVAEPGELDRAQVAIVPGSLVREDGSLGDVVAERVAAAVELHAGGVVDKLLVSGDNGTAGYDEPGAMRDAALAAGVPPQDVFTDYAGFSTWHTMRRAADVFGVESAVVVTQGTYAPRAVDLGRAAGIDTQAYDAGPAGRGAREVLARVRGFVEATVTPEVTGGDPIAITGDGRASWAD